MAVSHVRAIYENGRLRLLDPVDLDEGQQVEITIESHSAVDTETVRAKLQAAGLLVEIDVPDDAVALTVAERETIGRLFVGDRPSEDLIDEDRGLY